jgi:hypothetical protein
MTEEPTDNPSNLTPKMRHAIGLISALCDERITPEQFAELESLVCNDHEIGRMYVNMMHLNAALDRFAFYFAEPLPGLPNLNDLSE